MRPRRPSVVIHAPRGLPVHAIMRLSVIIDVMVMIAVDDNVRNHVDSDPHPRSVPAPGPVPDSVIIAPIIAVHVIHRNGGVSDDIDSGLNHNEGRRLIIGGDLRLGDVPLGICLHDAPGVQRGEACDRNHHGGEAVHGSKF